MVKCAICGIEIKKGDKCAKLKFDPRYPFAATEFWCMKCYEDRKWMYKKSSDDKTVSNKDVVNALKTDDLGTLWKPKKPEPNDRKEGKP